MKTDQCSAAQILFALDANWSTYRDVARRLRRQKTASFTKCMQRLWKKGLLERVTHGGTHYYRIPQKKPEQLELLF